MNNMIKKLILLILIFIIVLIGINIYTSLINTHSKEYESDIISKSNAKTLEIYNHRITNLSERSGNHGGVPLHSAARLPCGGTLW